MKKQINEIRRMQQLAGLITESEYQEALNEGFKDRISARRTDMKTPKDDMAIIFDAVKKEAGNDYEVVYNKGAIYVITDGGSGVIGKIIGIRIVQDPNSNAIKIGLTNGTIDTSGSTHMSGIKSFDPKDISGILDACSDMIQQIEDSPN
jgi:hypothetical protein